MPESIRDKYQYHTQADPAKLHRAVISDLFPQLKKGFAVMSTTTWGYGERVIVFSHFHSFSQEKKEERKSLPLQKKRQGQIKDVACGDRNAKFS
jgi:hypothetical protein